jgi:hypothetical protein
VLACGNLPSRSTLAIDYQVRASAIDPLPYMSVHDERENELPAEAYQR